MKKYLKKPLSFILMLAMLISMAVPVSAAAPSTMPEERQIELKAQLRAIIAGQTDSVSGFALGLLGDDAVKGLIKGAITSIFNLEALASGTGSGALSDLINGALGGLLGVDLSGLNLDGIIDGIVANEIVNGILTSDFLAKVIDRVLDNILDAIDLSVMAGVVTESVVDVLTEKYWNNGNPINFIGIGPLGWGAWNNSSNTWNTGGIILMMIADIGGSALGISGDISDYVDFTNIDFMSILPDLDVILAAILDAVKVTTIEYFNEFKDQLIQKVMDEINGYLLPAKAKLADEINSFFGGRTVVTADMSLAAMQKAIEAAIYDLKDEAREALANKMNALKKQVHSCIHSFIDKIIECCGHKCDKPTTDTGIITIVKTVLVDGESYPISTWLWWEKDVTDEVERNAILGDITFEIFKSNAAGDYLGKIAGAFGQVNGAGEIEFIDLNSVDRAEYQFESGWYIIHEILGDLASAYFQNAADLHFYFNAVNGAATKDAGPVFPADATFTIDQNKSNPKYLQAVLEKNGVKNYIRSSPILYAGGSAVTNFGGAFAASKFTATQNNGDEYVSFCADLGAIDVFGDYVIDNEKLGLTDDQMLKLTAALDHIYGIYGDDMDDADLRALLNVVVWNYMIVYLGPDVMCANDWWDRDNDDYYRNTWGELIYVEGNTSVNSTHTLYWYLPEYKDDIDNVVAHANDNEIVDLYKARVKEPGSFISGAEFLKGNSGFPKHKSQRQLIIWIDEPVEFENIPDDPGTDSGIITIRKMVNNNGEFENIVVWLQESKALVDDERDAILADISFKIYESNADGEYVNLIDGVTGEIQLDGNIHFVDGDGNDFLFETGWYIIEEIIGDEASVYLKDDMDDLHFYFNAVTEAVTKNADPVFPADATFTIDQNKSNPKYLQAILEKDGVRNYIRGTLPELKVGDEMAAAAGGAFATSKFTATQDNGDEYASFCADLGAIHAYGDYVIDEDNFGFTKNQMLKLTAALDHIYGIYGDDMDDPDLRALLNIVVWNYILAYRGPDVMCTNYWYNHNVGEYYIDLWGEIVCVEGAFVNSDNEFYWYLPEYKSDIDFVIAHANDNEIVDLYKQRIKENPDNFISGAQFLKGDSGFEQHDAQRQIIIWFGDPEKFVNEPVDDPTPDTTFFLDKVVLDNNEYWGIDNWLSNREINNGTDPEDVLDNVNAILEDISFEIFYKQNEDDEYELNDGVKGILESRSIIFVDENGDVYKDFVTGWYKVSEILTGAAAEIFAPTDYEFYFDADADVDPEEPAGMVVNNPFVKPPVDKKLPDPIPSQAHVADWWDEGYSILALGGNTTNQYGGVYFLAFDPDRYAYVTIGFGSQFVEAAANSHTFYSDGTSTLGITGVVTDIWAGQGSDNQCYYDLLKFTFDNPWGSGSRQVWLVDYEEYDVSTIDEDDDSSEFFNTGFVETTSTAFVIDFNKDFEGTTPDEEDFAEENSDEDETAGEDDVENVEDDGDIEGEE